MRAARLIFGLLFLGCVFGSLFYEDWLVDHRPKTPDAVHGDVVFHEINNHGVKKSAYISPLEEKIFYLTYGAGAVGIGIMVVASMFSGRRSKKIPRSETP